MIVEMTAGDGLIGALHSAGPDPALAAKLALFGRFVGSWDLDWSGRDAAGRPLSARGELHFGWVLGGRAIQDIWIVPGRGQPGEGEPPHAFHGSTPPLLRPGHRRLALDLDRAGQRAFAASSDGPTATTSCCSAARTCRSSAGASRRSAPTHSLERGEARDDGAVWTPDDEMRATRADRVELRATGRGGTDGGPTARCCSTAGRSSRARAGARPLVAVGLLPRGGLTVDADGREGADPGGRPAVRPRLMPVGSLLVVSMRDHKILRRDARRRRRRHADLSAFCGGHLNDMVVDAAGRAYVGNFGFDLSRRRPRAGRARARRPGRDRAVVARTCCSPTALSSRPTAAR